MFTEEQRVGNHYVEVVKEFRLSRQNEATKAPKHSGSLATERIWGLAGQLG